FAGRARHQARRLPRRWPLWRAGLRSRIRGPAWKGGRRQSHRRSEERNPVATGRSGRVQLHALGRGHEELVRRVKCSVAGAAQTCGVLRRRSRKFWARWWRLAEVEAVTRRTFAASLAENEQPTYNGSS